MVQFRIDCVLPFSRSHFWRLRSTPTFLDFVVSDGLLKRMTATPATVADDGWLQRRQRYCPARVDCPDMLRALVGDTMFEVDDHQRWNDQCDPFRIQYYIRPSFLAGWSKTSGVMELEELRRGPVEAEREEADKEEEEDGQEMRESAGEEAERKGGDGSEGTLTDVEEGEGGEGSEDGEGRKAEDMVNGAVDERERCVHVVRGETRVSIMTLGWFVEKAIVHNLSQFYDAYPATVSRFREKLYHEFAGGDMSMPCNEVVDRFMESERGRIAEREGKEAEEVLNANGVGLNTQPVEV